jgi:hypothetical protein
LALLGRFEDALQVADRVAEFVAVVGEQSTAGALVGSLVGERLQLARAVIDPPELGVDQFSRALPDRRREVRSLGALPRGDQFQRSQRQDGRHDLEDRLEVVRLRGGFEFLLVDSQLVGEQCRRGALAAVCFGDADRIAAALWACTCRPGCFGSGRLCRALPWQS